MTDTPKRRLLDRAVNTPTLIGLGTQIEGEFKCPGDLAVAGAVVGNTDVGGLFTLADTGSWHGQLHCENAVIAGKVIGDIAVRQNLEIRGTAHIDGRIAAQHVAIAEGAVVQGELKVLSGEPVQRFAEKREAVDEADGRDSSSSKRSRKTAPDQDKR
jgi:cytoskeletal protein CcmA (bactofilin family)